MVEVKLLNQNNSEHVKSENLKFNQKPIWESLGEF